MTLSLLTELFEALTIFCFGLSWPVSVYKSYVSRTAKGKSLTFEIFILIGYVFGIARKIIQISALNYPTMEGFGAFVYYMGFVFYVLNFIEIAFDILLYFRNTKLDKLRDEGKEV